MVETSDHCQVVVSADGKQADSVPMAKIEPWMNLPWLVSRRAQENPRQTVIERKNSLGTGWSKVSAGHFLDQINAVARGLVASGIEVGQAVAIMAQTSYEWTLLDFACWSAGAVVVPIYETSSAAQIEWVLRDSNVSLVITEDSTMAELVSSAGRDCTELREVLALQNNAVTELIERGRKSDNTLIQDRLNRISPDCPATIIYTSGTTGRPKGVVLTHGNFLSLALNGLHWLPEVTNRKDTRLLLFLPLAHSYARFLQVFAIAGPGVLGHAANIATLLPDLASFKPSYVLAVPRVLEKIYNRAEATAGSGIKLRLFRLAAKAAIDYSQALDTPKGPSTRLRLTRQIFDHLVYSKIVTLLGGNAKYAISGGAPLGQRLGHFYRGIGIHILEGYGLTETTAPLAVNTPSLCKIGSVGAPVPTVSVRLSDSGELLVKGPSVTKVYLNNPAATTQAIDQEGWFHTGDLASIDSDGYIFITGRAKELIVTAGGKNVQPAVLEDSLRGHPLISQVVVIGDKRPFIAALVTLDAEMLPTWLKNHNLPIMGVSQASRHRQVLAALDRAVARANKSVSRAESIRKIVVLPVDFTEANGLLTPSLKVKRSYVAARFTEEIDEIYGGPIA